MDKPERKSTAQNQPPKAATDEGLNLYVQHCELCALEGRPNELGLSAIARPADATLH